MRDDIVRLYLTGLNTREVAAKLGCGKSWVAKVIKITGISRPKKPSEASQRKRINTCPPLSKKFLNYLDGLLISDGSIMPGDGKSPSAWYRQTCSRLEWLETIQKEFSENGIKGTIGWEGRAGKTSHWQYQTRRYIGLVPILNRWYKNSTKSVPGDIDIRDTTFIRNWIYGDGTLICNSTLRFCTDSFSEDEVDDLVTKINKAFDVTCKKMLQGHAKNGTPKFRITLCMKDGLESFYEQIGEPDLTCYSYKWRI